MIKHGIINVGNVKKGTKQIDKVLKGNKKIWENWRQKTGNCLTNDNTTLNVTPVSYQALSVDNWKSLLFGNVGINTNTNFHDETCVATFNQYETKHITEITVTRHSNPEEDTFVTSCDISVSQDNNAYYTLATESKQGTYAVDYKTLGIDYVRYIKIVMHMQNSSFPGPDPMVHITPSINVSKYLQKGE